MINKIIELSLKNRLLTLIISVIVIITGAVAVFDMDIDVFPDLTAPTVVVLTESHGMASEEIEKMVTFPIETALNGATDVRRVRSSTAAGISIVWVDFGWGTDIFKARQIVSEKLTAISASLPKGIGNPILAPQSSIIGEIMLLAVSSDSLNQMDLRTFVDQQLRRRLLSLSGVSQVIVVGGEHKQYQLLANPERMKYFNVTFQELVKSVEDLNKNASGGFINEFGNEYLITSNIRSSDTTEISNSVIKIVNGKPVKLSDVTRLAVKGSPKIGDGYLNGKPSVILTVLKQPNTNTLKITENIEVDLAKLRTELPSHLKINSEIFKQSDFINAAVNNVQKSLIEGSIFVILILYLFLGNIRTTVISLITIPISLLFAFLTLQWLGFNINTMSLGGMAIAIGALVDDAIIDVDNVLKRLKQNALKSEEEKQNIIQVIFEASKEIRASIFNATLIIIVAFVPMFFLAGMEGRLLKPLGVSFIVSLTASLVVSLTLTPVLCSYLLNNPQKLSGNAFSTKWISFIDDFYERTLIKLFLRKKFVIIISVVMFVLSIIIMSGFGRSFLPTFNEGTLTLSTVSLPGISLDESNKLNMIIENELLSMPEVRAVTRRTGRAELDEHAQGVFSSEVDVPFTLKDRSKDEFLAELRLRCLKVGGINVTVGQPLEHRIDHMLSGTRANIAIKIFGTDLKKMFSIANNVKSKIENIEGLVDVSVEQQVDVPQIQIKPNRELLSKYGISIPDFYRFIDVSLGGEKLSEVYDGAQNFDLVLKYDDQFKNGIESIKNILIDTYDGNKIPLMLVADVSSTSTPNSISRENVQRKIVVSGNVAERDLRSVVNDIKSTVDKNITLPANYRIEYGGQFESEEKASQLLIFSSLISILVIFVLLFQEFKNFKLSSIIMLNLPLSLIGGVFSIWITSNTLSIPAIIGFITLFGIATRNGILLISRYQSLKGQGLPLMELIIKGSKDRLYPILMTALTASLALLPLVIAGSEPGNEIQSPMAIVILGGLLTSTFLNIFLIPIVYYIFADEHILKRYYNILLSKLGTAK